MILETTIAEATMQNQLSSILIKAEMRDSLRFSKKLRNVAVRERVGDTTKKLSQPMFRDFAFACYFIHLYAISLGR